MRGRRWLRRYLTAVFGNNVRVIPLREPLWKVTFLIPKDGAGKELVLRFRSPAGSVEEKKAVEAG